MDPIAPAVSPADDRIDLATFQQVELRAATVISAERVEGSRKLIKLEVDLGSERRTLVAGIAQAYEPAALIGRRLVVVANLKPARLMGIESNGMVLAADVEGRPILATFAEDVPNGTLLR